MITIKRMLALGLLSVASLAIAQVVPCGIRILSVVEAYRHLPQRVRHQLRRP